MFALASIVAISFAPCSNPEHEGATGSAAGERLTDPIIADDGTGLGS